VPTREGKAAFLTLDHTIQANAEQVLRATVAHWHAKSATAIVLDPKTGGVLAMAMQPGYDANQVASRGLQGNQAVSDVFGDNAVIGTSAVVTVDVPENAVVAGIPAKVIRKRDAPKTFRWE